MEKGYNLKEVAELLGIRVRTARQWVKDGKIKAHKIPGTNRWMVLESEIKRLQCIK
ncbi:MAG TPA: DNA-binding protein [Erysipelotrichaceae bacterium]|nr:DNA-binding protein [Erysipelotrichaceae bacterium]